MGNRRIFVALLVVLAGGACSGSRVDHGQSGAGAGGGAAGTAGNGGAGGVGAGGGVDSGTAGASGSGAYGGGTSGAGGATGSRGGSCATSDDCPDRQCYDCVIGHCVQREIGAHCTADDPTGWKISGTCSAQGTCDACGMVPELHACVDDSGCCVQNSVSGGWPTTTDWGYCGSNDYCHWCSDPGAPCTRNAICCSFRCDASGSCD